MANETFYTESGNSPPKRKGFELKWTPWATPLLAVTDDYEEVVLGFRVTSRGMVYMAASGREVPAKDAALFHLGTEGGVK